MAPSVEYGLSHGLDLFLRGPNSSFDQATTFGLPSPSPPRASCDMSNTHSGFAVKESRSVAAISRAHLATCDTRGSDAGPRTPQVPPCLTMNSSEFCTSLIRSMWLIRFSGGGKEALRQALLMLRDTLFEGGRMARHTGKQNEENGWTLCKPADYVSGKVMARTIWAARVPVYPPHSVTQSSSARDIEATLAPLTTEKGGDQENNIKTGVFTRSKARMAYCFIATCAALPLLVSFLNCKCNCLTHACSSLRDYLSCSIVSDYSWQLIFLPRAPKFLSTSYLFILVVPLLRCAQEVITQLPSHPPSP